MKTPSLPRFRRSVFPAAMAVLLILFPRPLHADVVIAWNEMLLHISATAPADFDPLAEARVYAMVHLAMAEAIEAAGDSQSGPATALTASRAAAVAAAQDILSALLPRGRSGYAALADRILGTMPDGADKSRGLAVGRETATRWVRGRGGDGWMAADPRQGADDAGHIPPDTADAALVRGEAPPPTPWMRAVPFQLKSVGQFAPPEVRTVDRAGQVINESWVRDSTVFDGFSADKVMRETDAQRPFAAWNRVARLVAGERNLDLREEARLLATLNTALADATLAAQHWGRTLASWRVVAAERWDVVRGEPPQSTDVIAMIDGLSAEPVRRSTQLVLIPPTPDFPSVAATQAGAAQAALVTYFRSDDVSFAWPQSAAGSDRESPGTDRRFPRISAAARERAFQASLDGRHSREACLSGYTLGLEIGRYGSRRAWVKGR